MQSQTFDSQINGTITIKDTSRKFQFTKGEKYKFTRDEIGRLFLITTNDKSHFIGNARSSLYEIFGTRLIAYDLHNTVL